MTMVVSYAHAQDSGSVVPIVAAHGLVLGGSRGGKWLSSKQVSPFLKSGAKYRFYTLKGYDRTSVGSKADQDEDGGGGYFVTFPESERKVDRNGIGLGGSWNPMPRLPRMESTHQKIYLDAVATLLKAKGLAGATPNITRLMRVDLQGKGQDAVLIEAASPDYRLATGSGGDLPRQNSYSFVMLRMISDGALQTFFLDGVFYKSAHTTGAASQHLIANVIDLNGDGVLEIVLNTRYYESSGTTVYEVKSGSPKIVIGAGSGN